MNTDTDTDTDTDTKAAAVRQDRAEDELVRGVYAHLAAQRFDEAMAHIAPDAVLHVPGRHPMAGDHVGHEGLAWFLGASAAAADLTEDVVDVLGGEQTVAALVHVQAQRADGRTLDNPTIHRFRVRDGLVHEVWFHNLDQHAVDAFWS